LTLVYLIGRREHSPQTMGVETLKTLWPIDHPKKGQKIKKEKKKKTGRTPGSGCFWLKPKKSFKNQGKYVAPKIQKKK